MPHAWPSKPRRLSPREREIAAMADLPNYEIAQRLKISKQTVKIQIGRIRNTLGIRDREEIVKYVKSEAAQQ
jgi:DNA-binding CsgD family transcriptional regulator